MPPPGRALAECKPPRRWQTQGVAARVRAAAAADMPLAAAAAAAARLLQQAPPGASCALPTLLLLLLTPLPLLPRLCHRRPGALCCCLACCRCCRSRPASAGAPCAPSSRRCLGTCRTAGPAARQLPGRRLRRLAARRRAGCSCSPLPAAPAAPEAPLRGLSCWLGCPRTDQGWTAARSRLAAAGAERQSRQNTRAEPSRCGQRPVGSALRVANGTGQHGPAPILVARSTHAVAT